jgi:hypothetical protein
MILSLVKELILSLCVHFSPQLGKFLNFLGFNLVRRKSVDIYSPPPPNIPPERLIDDFTMNNAIPVLYIYSNEKCNSRDDIPHNTEKTYRKTFRKLNNRSFRYYGNEIKAFYDALYKYPLNDRNVIIFGLTGCNCDAISVWNNAKKVYVVDYNKPVCEHPQIEVLTQTQIKEINIKFDAGFSYSSFEHDGLGRYGDPIDPNGDLRAMEEARGLLSDGGILFLGVPFGQDTLVWNVHRIYGKIRIPLLLKGWQCLDVYNTRIGKSLDYPFDLQHGDFVQCLLVLKKIKTPYPDNLELSGQSILDTLDYQYKTHSPDILRRINQMILDYKEQYEL